MHKDYIKQPEVFTGLLPSVNAIEVIDYYANNKSTSDVQGLLRVNGSKVSLNVIKTVYSHIKLIEDTMIRMLNGTSMIYNPPKIFDEKDEFIGFAFESKLLPNTVEELINNIMFVISLEGDNFANVYDADFSELTLQITKVVENILEVQSGTFEELRDLLKPA